MTIDEFYLKDSNFREYVDRYCRKCGIPAKEAFKHKIIIDVYLRYRKDGAIK